MSSNKIRTFNGTKLTADCLIFTGQADSLSLLLVKRKYPPYQDYWALPGGFLEEDEAPSQAALRELQEETGLQLHSELKPVALSIRQKLGRDPRGHTVTYPFVFHLKDEVAPQAGDDAAEARWFKLSDINELAFDHGAMLCEALGQIWPMVPANCGRSVTFFPGSFNPWHEGHQACIDLFKQNNPSGTLVLVPDTNPWKGQEQYEAHCRWASFKKLKEKHPNVYPGFWGREEKNPTVTWFPKISSGDKGLLLGDDTFFDLEKWQNGQTLLQNLDHLFVVPRSRDLSDIREQRSLLLQKYPKIKIEIFEFHRPISTSSSAIRGGHST